MDKVDLKKEFPNILVVCREQDCNYTEAKEIIREEKKKGTLLSYGGE